MMTRLAVCKAKASLIAKVIVIGAECLQGHIDSDYSTLGMYTYHGSRNGGGSCPPNIVAVECTIHVDTQFMAIFEYGTSCV